MSQTHQGTHHFAITLQTPKGAFLANEGTFTPPPGMTRADLAKAIRAGAEQGQSEPTVLIFLSIERNEL